MGNILFDIGSIIIIATLIGFIARLFRQPLIPSYILAGIILGPVGLKIVEDTQTIALLSEIGIAFLLFIVGMELDMRKLKDISFSVSLSGVIQISLMFFIGLIIGNLLGAFHIIDGSNLLQSVYFALMVSFSSTLVVIKMISDKEELDTLHGRIIIGILLIEDLFAVLAISVLSIDHFTGWIIIGALAKGLFVVILAILLGKYVFNSLFGLAAKSTEMLFLMSLTVCFAFVLLAGSLGLSIVIGSFMAGVALSNLPYHFEIISKVMPLRDFFATIFFVTLGMEIIPRSLHAYLIPLVVLTFVVIIIKPLLIMLLQALFGFTARTAFLTGINLAQVSEFMLIIVAQGYVKGHISGGLFSMTVILATITITMTSYFIKFDNQLYRFFQPYLRWLDRLSPMKHEPVYDGVEQDYEAILIGYNRIAYSIAKKLRQMEKKFLVIDYNPDLIKRLQKEKIPCIYGDVANMEILKKINFKKVELVISTVPDPGDNNLVVDYVKNRSHRTIIFVTATNLDEALLFYDHGADYVILPHYLGGDHVSMIIEDTASDISKILANKMQHIDELKERKRYGHDHPRWGHPSTAHPP
ncbi:MAG: hypothetical protein GXP63_03800 [DPANN group archaeon]|nr:hypothetical protein [DPANN group archaeon]